MTTTVDGVQQMPISHLTPADYNPRRIRPAQLDALKRSLTAEMIRLVAFAPAHQARLVPPRIVRERHEGGGLDPDDLLMQELAARPA